MPDKRENKNTQENVKENADLKREEAVLNSPEVRRTESLADTGSQVKSEAQAHEENRSQVKEMVEQNLDTTPDAAEASRQESRERVASERKAEGRFTQVGEGGGEEMAKKVVTPEDRIVDQTNQREQQGYSASDPSVVYAYTTREAGETAYSGKKLNQAGTSLMNQFLKGLSSSERDIYERNPGAALRGFRGWLEGLTDTQLEDVLYGDNESPAAE